jgi:YgiT-type zinc finger domain-containing protein
MICDICGKQGANIRHVNRNYGKGTDIFIIMNVPAVSCPHCKQNYFTADTLYEIERIKLNRKSIAEEHSIPVAGFGKVSEKAETLIGR